MTLWQCRPYAAVQGAAHASADGGRVGLEGAKEAVGYGVVRSFAARLHRGIVQGAAHEFAQNGGRDLEGGGPLGSGAWAKAMVAEGLPQGAVQRKGRRCWVETASGRDSVRNHCGTFLW